MNAPRVLLAAYQCAPEMGSVSQIGWEWYSRLSRETPVTLVTHSRNRKNLEAAGAPRAGSEVLYIDTEWFAGPLYRLAAWLFPRSEHAVYLICSLDFYVYDVVAVRRLRRSRQTWDVIHAVTPVSPLAVTRLYKLGSPLLVGPWNGGLPSPTKFPEIMRDDSGWIYKIRGLGRLLDFFIGCTRNARAILSATSATDRSLPKGAHIERMLEIGVDLDLFQPNEDNSPPSSTNPLRILFAGRLIPVKGVSMLLEAVARVQKEIPVRVTIIGDGPLYGRLCHEARDQGLDEIVSFLKAQPLSAVAQYMANSHLFCLPCVRESGGAVLLEAMACALPVVAVNYGGPAELVDNEVGRLLSAEGPEELTSDMAATFLEAFRHPEEWRRRGQNGRRRAQTLYGWPARVQRVVSLYREVSEERSCLTNQSIPTTQPL